MQKIALITGASSGFGMRTALELVKDGFTVVATMRNLEQQSVLRDAAKQAGMDDRLLMTQLDVTDTSRIQEVVHQTIEQFGRIDLLVNNAGFALAGLAEAIPIEKWRAQFETNVFGLIQMTQAVMPQMRRQQGGTIINLSSISGRIGFPMMAPYAASKHAVEGFSEALRLEVAPLGIRVVLIEPGAFQTNIWEKGMASAGMSNEADYTLIQEYILSEVGRSSRSAGDPQQVARLIVEVANHPQPKLRYPIGTGVKQAFLLKQLVPWSWIEKMMVRNIRKKQQGE